MKFLAFVTHFLLATVLTITILLLVIDHTVSAAYVTSVAERTNASVTLSALLPQQLAGQAKPAGQGENSPQSPGEQDQMLAVLKAALTPDFVQRFIANASVQLEGVLKHGAPQATLDLSEIRAKAIAAGATPDAAAFAPVVISAEKLQKPKMVLGWLKMAELGGLAASIVLLALSLLVSYKRRSYRGLAMGLADVALSEAILVAALFVIPEQILAKVHLNESVAPFLPLIQSLLGQLAADWRLYFGGAGAVAAGCALGLLLFGKHLPMRKLAAVVPEPTDIAAKPMKQQP